MCVSYLNVARRSGFSSCSPRFRLFLLHSHLIYRRSDLLHASAHLWPSLSLIRHSAPCRIGWMINNVSERREDAYVSSPALRGHARGGQDRRRGGENGTHEETRKDEKERRWRKKQRELEGLKEKEERKNQETRRKQTSRREIICMCKCMWD